MSVDQLGKFRPELLAFLAREYPGAVVGKKKVHFCGVVSPRAGESFLFLPRGAGENETGDAARLVMRTLARFGEEVQSRVGNSSHDGDESSLAAAIYNVAADYMKYGLYAQRLRVGSMNTGKPDWKRTIQRQAPMINRAGKPVYASINGSRFLNASDNILAAVQAETLRDIVSKHGWWVGLDHSNLSDLASIPVPAIPEARFVSALERFKIRLFDDRSLQLASSLQQYWAASATQVPGSFICGVSDFSAVWEHMLKKQFRTLRCSGTSDFRCPDIL